MLNSSPVIQVGYGKNGRFTEDLLYLVTKVDNVRAALHARCPVDKGDRLVGCGGFVCMHCVEDMVIAWEMN